MRKVTTTVAAALVALSFAACSKTNNSVTPEEGNGTGTKGAVIAQISAGATNRALSDGQKDVAGVGGEDLVKTGYLFFRQGKSVDLTMEPKDGSKYAYKSQIFETAPNAAANATLLLNKNLELSVADFKKDKTISLDNLKDFIKTEGFMMTSTVEASENNLNIETGKTDDDVNNKGANNFPFTVERVVSKLQVSRLKDVSLTVSDALKAMGTVSFDLKYALAGSAKTAYLFRDNAGSRTLATTDGKHIYTGFKSVIDGETTPELQKVSDKKDNKLTTTEYYLDGYYTTPNEVGTVDASNKVSLDKGFFFLENSMYHGTDVATAKKQIFFKRIAYAKVYTTFAPKTGKKINGTLDKLSYETSDLTDAVAGDFTAERKYKVIVPKAWYLARKDKAEYQGKFDVVAAVPADPSNHVAGHEEYVTFKVTDKVGDFYVGGDGKIYDTQLAAAAAGNDTYRKFTGGKMVYMTPANAQKAGDLINYCDTRRNNIYDLTIVGFKALGENYDPVDPKDPNIPEPDDNPGEPEPDHDKPVQEEVTKMMVIATILQWNDVNRNVTLGE